MQLLVQIVKDTSLVTIVRLPQIWIVDGARIVNSVSLDLKHHIRHVLHGYLAKQGPVVILIRGFHNQLIKTATLCPLVALKLQQL